MFGLFEGLKMRLLALMAMLMTAGPATVATVQKPPITPAPPKTVLSQQTVTPPTTPSPKKEDPAKDPPKNLTPSGTQPSIITPPPDNDNAMTPVKPRRCSCSGVGYQNQKCVMYCAWLDNQDQQQASNQQTQ